MPHAVRLLAVALAAVAALAACSGPSAPPSAPPGAVEPGAAAFPVTVEHAFGSTVVPAGPQRVVSAGYTEQDTLLALGVVPVAVTDWYGDSRTRRGRGRARSWARPPPRC